MKRKEVIERLAQLDIELMMMDLSKVVPIYIAGGAALFLHGVQRSETEDIDAFKVEKKLKEVFADYDINDQLSKIFKADVYKKYLRTTILMTNYQKYSKLMYIRSMQVK